ncbi:hypothetical protein [Microbacterium sp. ZW T5_56]|uniref:hypothetical protein n=1 Tax=Microbacterium sp. ZW T5_56 TaxID=3378081 RepID=UPI0038538233
MSESPVRGDESLDDIARDLQALRHDAGPVSYAEIVRRIAALRMAQGMNPAAATPARSTVYNVFQTGRTRMDTALLRDVVRALGERDGSADAWVQRCRAATRLRGESTVPLASNPVVRRELRPPALVLALFGLVVLNHASHWFLASPLDLPVYLDMVGTAVAALAFGPGPGAAVAIVTGLTGPLFEDGILAFTLVNITGALVWGFGVRRFRLGHDIARYFVLTVLVATACSLVATPILVVIRGGAYGSVGRIAESLQEAGVPFLAATFASNISTSLMDKLISGFAALTIFAVLHARWGLSAGHMPLVERIGALRESQRPVGARGALSV